MSEIFGYLGDNGRIPNVFEDREISELIYDVFNLIHDYDWYASGDTGEDDYLEAKSKFKKKWLNNNSDRAKRIVDKAIEELKEELYKTYEVENKK